MSNQANVFKRTTRIVRALYQRSHLPNKTHSSEVADVKLHGIYSELNIKDMIVLTELFPSCKLRNYHQLRDPVHFLFHPSNAISSDFIGNLISIYVTSRSLHSVKKTTDSVQECETYPDTYVLYLTGISL